MEIVQGSVGAEGKYDVSFTGGKLVITSSYSGAELGAAFSASLDSDKLLDVLAEKIGGQVAPEIIALIKVALKAV
jgi:hypothetical protein